MKKIKRGKYPKKQNVTREEIENYLIKNYGVEVKWALGQKKGFMKD